VGIFNLFRTPKPSSAAIAKERLQILVAYERGKKPQPDYFPALKEEIIKVVRKYITIPDEQIQVGLENQGDCSVLEMNIVLPEDNTLFVAKNIR